MKYSEYNPLEFDGMIRAELERMVGHIHARIMNVRDRNATQIYLLQTFEILMFKSKIISDLVYDGQLDEEVGARATEGELRRCTLILYEMNRTEGRLDRNEVMGTLYEYVFKNLLDMVLTVSKSKIRE